MRKRIEKGAETRRARTARPIVAATLPLCPPAERPVAFSHHEAAHGQLRAKGGQRRLKGDALGGQADGRGNDHTRCAQHLRRVGTRHSDCNVRGRYTLVNARDGRIEPNVRPRRFGAGLDGAADAGGARQAHLLRAALDLHQRLHAARLVNKVEKVQHGDVLRVPAQRHGDGRAQRFALGEGDGGWGGGRARLGFERGVVGTRATGRVNGRRMRLAATYVRRVSRAV